MAVAGMKVEVEISESLTGTKRVLGGQRSATLNRSAESIDVTSKTSKGYWTEKIAGFKSWSVDCDGVVVESDEALKIMENKFLAGETVAVFIKMPSGDLYSGLVTITDFPNEFPYDDAITYSLTLEGNGELKKTPKV